MQKTAAEELPAIAQIDYKGDSREYLKAGGAVVLTFALALLIVYLVLAAQFESFMHPFVIMLTVPLAVLGALLGLWLTGNTPQPVQPDRHRHAGRAGGEERHPDRRVRQPAARRRHAASHEAIVESAAVRLRPILMTSIATIAGAVPLVLAGGPARPAVRRSVSW